MKVSLTKPLIIAGREVGAIELRVPGRRVFEAMRAARGPVRFADASVARFGARLSEHTEPTFRRLSPEDAALVAEAIEQLYVQARRRFAARTALAETAKAAREAVDD